MSARRAGEAVTEPELLPVRDEVKALKNDIINVNVVKEYLEAGDFGTPASPLASRFKYLSRVSQGVLRLNPTLA